MQITRIKNILQKKTKDIYESGLTGVKLNYYLSRPSHICSTCSTENMFSIDWEGGCKEVAWLEDYEEEMKTYHVRCDGFYRNLHLE